MSLDDLRRRIDEIDRDLVRLLNARMRAVVEIGKLKAQQGSEAYAPAREKQIFERLQTLNQGPLPDDALQAIYREIMSSALALEKNVRVAYLGPPATFTHQAARSRFGSSVDYLACETIGDIFEVVSKKQADYGVVPVENSTEGAVTDTMDCFVNTTLKICAEIALPVSHCLMSRAPREKIRRLFTLPQVLGQCRRWIQREMPNVEILPAASTARAAQMAAETDDGAALAGSLAAEIYGLSILAADVEDLSGNITRFVVIGKSFGGPTGHDRTSVIFSVKHEVGTLYAALAAFREYGLNLTRIESRPSKSRAWEYYFFVDVEGHVESASLKSALAELERHCTVMRVLGSYPIRMDTP